MLTALPLLWIVVSGAWILRRGAEGLVIAMAIPIRVGGLAPAEWLAPFALAVELTRRKAPLTHVPFAPGRLTIASFLVVALYVASGLWSESPSVWLKGTAGFGIAFATAISLYLYGKRTGPVPGWRIFWVTLLAIALTALAFEALGRPEVLLVSTYFSETGLVDERFASTSPRGGHPWIGPSTYLASFLAVLFVVSYGLPGNRILRGAGILAAVSGLLLAASWGGIAASAIGILIVIATKSSWPVPRRLLVAVLIVPIALWAARAIALTREGGPSDNGRLDLYSQSWAYILERPLLGFGPETWKITPGLEGGTHSILLTVPFEFGLLGALLIFTWVAIALMHIWRTEQVDYRALALGTVAAAVGGSLVQASLEGAFFRQLAFGLLGFMIGIATRSSPTPPIDSADIRPATSSYRPVQGRPS